MRERERDGLFLILEVEGPSTNNLEVNTFGKKESIATTQKRHVLHLSGSRDLRREEPSGEPESLSKYPY